MLIHDDVTATDPAFVKKWLLHTVARPQVDGLMVLRGSPDDGILQSASARAVVRNGDGVLVLDRLFPRDAVLRLVGGETHRFYVEVDGDERELDGENFAAGASGRPWFDHGRWRIEIQPPAERTRDRFLVLLSPSIETARLEQSHPLRDDGGIALGARTLASASLFVDARSRGQAVLRPADWPPRLYLI